MAAKISYGGEWLHYSCELFVGVKVLPLDPSSGLRNSVVTPVGRMAYCISRDVYMVGM